MANSQICAEHNVEIEIQDANGNLLEKREIKNLVTDAELNLLRDMMASYNSIVGAPYTIRLGTGTTAPTATDTALEIEQGSRVIDRRQVFDKQVKFAVLYPTSELNGLTLTEEGMFTVDGTLAARALIEPPVNKTAAIQLTINHIITLSRPS